jgi:hypothetical protein
MSAEWLPRQARPAMKRRVGMLRPSEAAHAKYDLPQIAGAWQPAPACRYNVTGTVVPWRSPSLSVMNCSV